MARDKSKNLYKYNTDAGYFYFKRSIVISYCKIPTWQSISKQLCSCRWLGIPILDMILVSCRRYYSYLSANLTE